MIQANGKIYKTFLLDTNIIINLLKDKEIFGSKVMNLVLSKGIFVFSSISLWELSIDFKAFNEFKRIFLSVPSILGKANDDILNKEISLYYSNNRPTLADVGIFFNASYFKAENISIEKIIDQHIAKERSEQYKIKEKESFLDIAKGKIAGFIQKDEFHDKKRVRQSVELFAYQLIAENNYSFAKLISNKNEALDVYKCPSAVSMSYIYHYKFLNERRHGEPSDLSDILITPLLPYVDCYITENSVASNIREIQNTYGFFKNLEVLVTKDINALAI